MSEQRQTYREKVLRTRENAKGDDFTEEGIAASMEVFYDALIDIHKEYIETEADDAYVDFFNLRHSDTNTDDVYVKALRSSIPETNTDADLHATLKSFYAINKEENKSEAIPMLTRVQITDIDPLGVVTFLYKKEEYKAYPDELFRYEFKK
jgi:hypothetical protein